MRIHRAENISIALTPRVRPSDLRREAEAMIRAGTMPSLETVLQAVADAREKYAQQISWACRPSHRLLNGKKIVARRKGRILACHK